MYTLFATLGTVLGIVLVKYLFRLLICRSRRLISKNWKVNDVLILNLLSLSNALRKHLNTTEEEALLSGWNSSNVFIRVGDKVFVEKWSSVYTNKSNFWRVNYDSCTKFMGQNPNFGMDQTIDSSSDFILSSDFIDGKHISTLNETLCQIYLAKAIESENYELAEKLKNQLKKFK